ncbi:MAG: nucleotidyl transferase AbiEii/AbiGii toxin family protein [Candidatus Omnitrophica bacterium]|nr:nucleotidyl transferase AbiEii/AbiGii toxin family protein [Candidatus Omnitrophota bacterium]
MKDHCLALVAAKSGYNEKLNAMREYLQAYILSFMYEGGVFRHAAFVGGTALRFLHGLPRFSEDLDFSQAGKDKVDFGAMMSRITRELELAGYDAATLVDEDKTVNSAFIKFEALMHEAGISPLKSQKFSVKIEIDTNPPRGAVLEQLLVNKYFPINFLTYDRASLFAGKVHAILCRKYTKGRDLFDLVWYLMTWKDIEPNFIQLNNALTQSKWQGPVISNVNWREVARDAVAKADWKKVRSDVEQFLEHPHDIELLSQESALKMLS